MTQIIACIDGSKSATAVCDASAWCATTLNAPVLALHVLDRAETPALADLTGAIGLGAREQLLKELADLDHQRVRLAAEEGKIMLEAAGDQLLADGVVDARQLQRHGSLAEALDDLSDDTRVVIIGRQGQTHQSAAETVGSQLETIVRTAKHPVWVTPSTFVAPKRCVIAYDASTTAKHMIERLCHSPLLTDMDATLVMAGNDTDEHRQQLAYAQRQLEDAGHTVSTQLVEGEPLVVLHELAQSDDTLLAMGAFGHSRIREFLVGSTTNETLRHARSSVVLFR